MRHVTLLVLLACFQYDLLFSQCDDYIVKGSQIFHANDIRTVINTGGDMFWDLEEARFQVPYTGSNTPSAIFAASVWIGGYDDVGNLKGAGQQYRDDQLRTQEYLPGPLTSSGALYNSDCADWDTIWSVSRHEILLHIRDFNEDSVIDHPQPSIFGWPGIGNVFFLETNGFDLPDLPVGFYPNSYAPFFDKDLNGIYSPQNGDFPLPKGLPESAIPDQITWHIFNDVRQPRRTGVPMFVEIQQTCYAFYCQEKSVLDATLFMDFDIVSRTTYAHDSIFFGLWMDPDLGCYTDDFVGSSPKNNGFFIYNEDALDGTVGSDCDFGLPSYLAGPPVLSGCFVNQEMTSFTVHYYHNWLDLLPPLIDPNSPIEYYRLLTGSWRDGSPLCEGGIGYNPGPDCVPTKFAFPGNPNDSTSWAMINVDVPDVYKNVVASTEIGSMDPGEHTTITMSFALHLDPEKNHLENVELMYEELPLLKTIFENGFVQCEKPTTPCLDDCVWPGDANNDGIVNNFDILDLAYANGKTGPARNQPLSWLPHTAEPWADLLPSGKNVKHCDVDGNGTVSFLKDIDLVYDYHGLTHSGYQQEYSCDPGEGIVIERGFNVPNPTGFQSATSVQLNASVFDSLYGIAFTLLYDENLMEFIAPVKQAQPVFEDSVSIRSVVRNPGAQEFVFTRYDGKNQSFSQDRLFASFLINFREENFIPGKHDTLELCVANARAILADGTELPVGGNAVRYVFIDENPTAVSNVKSQEISVYPNPSTGLMHFEVPTDLIAAQYEVRQMSGQLYSSMRITNEVTPLDLPGGIYVLSIRSQNRLFVEKIVVLD